MTANAPNILLVMADQMAPAHLPIFGGAARAPFMQALARDGVVFDSAYCASPLCSPSRASLMTGLLPSRTRVYDNARGIRLRPSDFRPSPEAQRLPDDPVGQDALLRAGPAARLRGAPDDRHLSRRLRLDAGLGPSGGAAELVSQHELGGGGRRLRAHQPARLRRGGRLRLGAGDLRHRAVARPCARSCSSPPSPTRTIRSPRRSATGTSTATRTFPRPPRRSRPRRSTPIPAACAMFARSTPSR